MNLVKKIIERVEKYCSPDPEDARIESYYQEKKERKEREKEEKHVAAMKKRAKDTEYSRKAWEEATDWLKRDLDWNHPANKHLFESFCLEYAPFGEPRDITPHGIPGGTIIHAS